MKTIYKVILCVCVGICFIFAGVSMGGLSQIEFGHIFEGGWVWNAEPIHNIQYLADQKTKELKVNIFNANIEFKKSSDEIIRVEASSIYEGFEVYQRDNILVIDQAHHFQWFRDYERSQITVYLPDEYLIEKIKLSVNAGNAKIENLIGKDIKLNVGAGNLSLDGMECENLDIDVGMGSANLDEVRFDKNLNASVGMGNIDVEVFGHQSEYNYKMKAGLGVVKIGDEKVNGIGKASHSGTTSKMIDAKSGMGTVKVRMED